MLDNFSAYYATLVGEYPTSDNIHLVHLPPHSPDLNSTEQIWRAVKREIAAMFIMNYKHLTTTIAATFKKMAKKRSYGEK